MKNEPFGKQQKQSRITIMLVVALMATTAFFACSSNDDDDGNGTNQISALKVTKTELTFTQQGGTETFSAQAPQQAEATTDADWLTVTAGTMTSSLKVTPITVVAAPMTNQLSDRTATITVKAGQQTATVSVTQTAGDRIILDQTAFSVPAESSSIEVTVKANGKVEVAPNVSWILNTSTANTQAGSEYSAKYAFTVASNTTTSPRTGTITFTMNSATATVTVTQEAGQQSALTATAAQIAPLMVPGWNLGNTLEATGNALACETAWQPTKTTQAIIDCVKQAGFRSVRIPCSWDIHSDANGNIDPQWMARVKEIVDYCINDGLYVVLNDHWDGGWIEVLGFSKSSSTYQVVDEATITAKTERLKSIWTQIANAFQQYDEHLLFAGLNEPFQEYNLFNGRHQALTPILLRYNTAFVEAVRTTGGNNSNRTLVVQGPSTNIASACSYMTADKLPEEAGKLMVEVHFYDPGQFCGTFDASGTNAYYYWGTGNHHTSHNAAWGEESSMRTEFAKLKTTYTSKGYPVIIGEYAALQRKLTAAGQDQDKHDASVKLFYHCVNEYATNNGIIAFAWDTNYPAGLNTEAGSTTIIDRAQTSIAGNNAMQGILQGVAAAQWP